MLHLKDEINRRVIRVVKAEVRMVRTTVRVRAMAREKDQIGVKLVPEQERHNNGTNMKPLNLLAKTTHTMTIHQRIQSQSMTYVKYKQKKAMMTIRHTMDREIKKNRNRKKMTNT